MVKSKNSIEKLVVEINNAADEHITMDLSPLLSFGAEMAKKIVDGMKKFCSSYNSLGEAKKLRTLLKALGTYNIAHSVSIDDEQAVYNFWFGFRSYWFTSDITSQKLPIRNENWCLFIAFVNYLMDRGVFLSVPIPPGNSKLWKRNILSNSNHKKGSDPVVVTSLVPISLARSDEEYLDELQKDLEKSREIFLSCAQKEIDLIRSEKAAGDAIISSVDYEELSRLTELSFSTTKPYHVKKTDISGYASNPFLNQKKMCGAGVSLYGPLHPNGYAHILARIKHEHDGFYCFFNNGVLSKDDGALSSAIRTIPSWQTMGGHLGLLTTRKLVPFFVYILLNNPSFNVESLAKAELYGTNGIMKLLGTAGEESSNVRMKVKKPRARCEKSEVLDEKTKKVLQLLLDLTKPLRNYLKKIGDPNHNKLWLIGGSSGTGKPQFSQIESIRDHFGARAHRTGTEWEALSKGKACAAKNSFLASHDELKPYIGIANLSRLRTTVGLIEWFKTGGDAKAVARLLGNSVKVTLDHYIPQALQILMNRRLIRRFQNLLIIAATVGEPYMLEATDFSTIEDLHMFLAQMLEPERVNGNELLNELQKKLNGSKTTPVCELSHMDKRIVINVSADNLALLFIYEEYVKKAGLETQLKKDLVTDTSPSFWMELSNILRETIPKDESRRELMPLYKGAQERLPYLREKLDFSGFIPA
jgi:hypothetical protein